MSRVAVLNLSVLLDCFERFLCDFVHCLFIVCSDRLADHSLALYVWVYLVFYEGLW